jgi:isopentenyl diphosphate isomerase/L-lactate dehydrogenase-like FMN-dependent dehydrogenase
VFTGRATEETVGAMKKPWVKPELQAKSVAADDAASLGGSGFDGLNQSFT